jgi:phosphoribosylformimino-5-aminoimidazole carboxamide ribotide isomerase
MDLYPAIDLRAGRCVRLVEGDFDRETVYDGDPVAVAQSFVAAGARWVHVVDLDAARTGQPVNRAVIQRIAASVSVEVQAGGGVRTVDDAAALLEAGVARVVVGTAAVRNPEVVVAMAQRWPGRVAVGLDHRHGEVRVAGWTSSGGRRIEDLVPEAVAAGAAAVVVTDIGRDGRMAGPDLAGLTSLLAATGAPIIASGGVSGLDDVAALAGVRVAGPSATGRLGLAGVIAGKAIYEGALDVAAALGVLEGAP